MKGLLLILMLLALVVRSCCYDSYRFSSSYRLQEGALDGMPWYSLESSKAGEHEGGLFSQCVDGVQVDGDFAYIWVNGSQYPDYYVIDRKKDTCTSIPGLPPHIRLMPPDQFLRQH